MNTISMLEFRQDAEAVVRRLQQGEHLMLTYRGKAVAQLQPIQTDLIRADDPFYQLGKDAKATKLTEPLDNETIDNLLYGD